ncbi:hypothetical protein ABW19_dt0205722 [Dactylella cylindrospora]|nr:hypothetical protein ABW19_dt0205722 [Dactylella cylindrospora]
MQTLAPTPPASAPSPKSMSLSKASSILLPRLTDDQATIRGIQLGTIFSIDELGEILRSLMLKFGDGAGDHIHSSRKSLDEFTASDIPKRYSQVLRNLFSNNIPIINDFAVQTFYSAARTGELDLLKQLIDQGILGGTKQSRWHSYGHKIGATALQFSIEYRQGPATSLLLDNKVDVNVQPISDLSQSILKTAVDVQDPELVAHLLSLGAEDVVYNESYEVDLVRDSYHRRLISDGILWPKSFLGDGGIDPEIIFTALESAVFLGNEEIFYLILDDRVRRASEGQKPLPFDSVLHIRAVRFSGIEILEDILKCTALNIEINAVDIDGLTALEIAKDIDIPLVPLLLQYGAIDNSRLSAPVRAAAPAQKPGTHWNFSESELISLYEVMDQLQSLIPSFPWPSYRQSLECSRPFSVGATLEIRSKIVSEEPFAESFEVMLDPCLMDPQLFHVFQSLAVAGGNLPAQCLIDDENHRTINIDFYTDNRDVRSRILAASSTEELDAFGNEADASSSEAIDFELWASLDDLFWRGDVLNTIQDGLDRLGGPNQPEDDNGELPVLHPTMFIWALKTDQDFKKSLITLYFPWFDYLSASQLAAALRLAINLNSHKAIQAILALRNVGAIDDLVILEAVWHGDMETFDAIFNQANKVDLLGLKPGYLALISIIKGHVHKLVRLLEEANLDPDHVLEGGETLIEVAAKLGKMDIAKVLLNGGASHRLEKAKERASEAGYFALSEMIGQHIVPEQNMSIFSQPSPIAFTPSAPGVGGGAGNTPQSIVAQSPRDPLVDQYGLYISSKTFEEMFSEGPYGIPSHPPAPAGGEGPMDFEYP